MSYRRKVNTYLMLSARVQCYLNLGGMSVSFEYSVFGQCFFPVLFIDAHLPLQFGMRRYWQRDRIMIFCNSALNDGNIFFYCLAGLELNIQQAEIGRASCR